MADLAKIDLTDEAECLSHVIQVMVYLKKYITEHPVRYPAMMRLYGTILHGLIPEIHVNCPEDPDCVVNTGSPCGGLLDAFEMADECCELLDLEADFTAPSYVYPADFQI